MSTAFKSLLKTHLFEAAFLWPAYLYLSLSLIVYFLVLFMCLEAFAKGALQMPLLLSIFLWQKRTHFSKRSLVSCLLTFSKSASSWAALDLKVWSSRLWLCLHLEEQRKPTNQICILYHYTYIPVWNQFVAQICILCFTYTINKYRVIQQLHSNNSYK